MRIYCDMDDILCETAASLCTLAEREFGRVVAYEDVDIRKPPYITQYPELRGFMDIQPKEIRKNVSENNVLINCRGVKSGEWVTNETTVVYATDPGLVAIRRRLPAFKPIPFDKIGVLTNAYGVKTDLDLRNDDETNGMKGSPLGANVSFVHVSATW